MGKLNIPLFPEWCVVQSPETTCTFLGISLPCLPAVTEGTPFSLGIEEGHFWTFLVLLTIGLCALSYVKHPWNLFKHPMKITTALYSAETAFFAVFRYNWGLGRPLIVGAALHNLFEWIIVILLANGTNYNNVARSVTTAIFWILVVVAVSLMVPGLLTAFLVEQVTGIMLDFAMPLMYLSKCYFSDAKDVRRFYFLPAFAHTLHILFTILPLVFANFHIGAVSWYNSFYLETAIYVSAPMTHILYCIWAWHYDELVKLHLERQGGNIQPATEVLEPPSAGETHGTEPLHLIEEKYRIHKVRKYLFVGFLCGVLVLLVLPTIILGPCPTLPRCAPDGAIITGTSVATVHPGMGPAYMDLIASTRLVDLARAAPGNIHYEVVSNVQNQDEFRFIEKWSSRKALLSWMAGPPSQIFHTPEMKGLLVNEALHSLEGYHNYPPPICREEEHGAVSFNITSSCSKVWKKVSDWSNCEWIIGCKNALVADSGNPGCNPKRILVMDNGDKLTMVQRWIDHRGRSMSYEFVEPPHMKGYSTTVSMQGKRAVLGGGCSISTTFSIPKSRSTATSMLTVSSIYKHYFMKSIPGLQTLFSK